MTMAKKNQLVKMTYYTHEGIRAEMAGGSIAFAAEFLFIAMPPSERQKFLNDMADRLKITS
jgi:hypothetical protein